MTKLPKVNNENNASRLALVSCSSRRTWTETMCTSLLLTGVLGVELEDVRRAFGMVNCSENTCVSNAVVNGSILVGNRRFMEPTTKNAIFLAHYTSASHPARNLHVRVPKASRLIGVTRHCEVTACRVPINICILIRKTTKKNEKRQKKPKFRLTSDVSL